MLIYYVQDKCNLLAYLLLKYCQKIVNMLVENFIIVDKYQFFMSICFGLVIW
jgi:hypothetical protein